MKKNIIADFTASEIKKINETRGFKMPSFNPGDSVSVKYKITEGTTTRIQAFNGVVIAKTKSDGNYAATFTVRKISSGVGVERKFSTYSTLIAGVEILKRGTVNRAKLYYLSKLTGKASRIKEKLDFLEKETGKNSTE
jgi:large subunit ribosomal protein L19